MDIQTALRLRNLFPTPMGMAQPGLDTYSSTDPSANMPQLDNTPPADTNADLSTAFTPRHDITDAYTNALTSMPQRPHPGALRNIAAAIAGMGAGASAQGISGGQPIGFKYDPLAADRASDKVKYGDYDNQLSDWSNQVKALGLGANEEDRANIGEAKRIAADSDREIKQQKLEQDQQKIDFNWDKSQKIFETKKREADNKVAIADKQLMVAKQKVDVQKDNVQYMREFHQAEIASKQARVEAQKLADDHKLEEMQMQHAKVMAELEYRRANMNKTTNTDVTYNEAGQATNKRVTSIPNPAAVLTNPDTNERYDTSTWSAADIANAKAKGWK